MTSSYDVAIVLSSDTLDKGTQQLYAKPEAKTKIFSGNVSNQEMKSAGIDSVDWSIDASPTFTLSPPTQAQWDNTATYFEGKKPATPPSNSFQVELSAFSTTLNMSSGNPIALSFQAIVFSAATVSDDKINLGAVGVLPENVPQVGQAYLQIISAIAYTEVSKIIAGYSIPSTISVEGFDFTAPEAQVTGGHLVAASNLKATGAVNIDGVTWPDQDLAVLVSRNLMSTLVDTYKGKIIQEMDDKKIDEKNSNWAGSYSVSGGISNASIEVSSTLPSIDVSVTISATVSLGVSWWLQPLACAAETASNLL